MLKKEELIHLIENDEGKLVTINDIQGWLFGSRFIPRVAGADGSTDEGTGEGTEEGTDDDFDVEALKQELKAAKEAKDKAEFGAEKLRKEAKAAKERETALAEAKLLEEGKYKEAYEAQQKKLDELQKAIQQGHRDETGRRLAERLNIIDSDIVKLALKPSDLDDETLAEAKLSGYLANKPWAVKPSATRTGLGSPETNSDLSGGPLSIEQQRELAEKAKHSPEANQKFIEAFEKGLITNL